jgi:predicted ArsR family transcriptional regulator
MDPEPAAPLGESRERVLAVLRAAQRPVDVQEIAGRTGLHPNTARFHLDRLMAAGLVTREAGQRGQPGQPGQRGQPGQPGRPRAVYHVVPAGPGAGRSSYRLLAEILASLVRAMVPDPAQASTEAGHAWGRYLAQRPAPLERIDAAEACRRLTSLLADLGFAAESVATAPGIQIRLRHCPFHELAEKSQVVVCSLHLGLMQGALAEMGAPLSADGLDPFVEPSLCLAQLRPAPTVVPPPGHP